MSDLYDAEATLQPACNDPQAKARIDNWVAAIPRAAPKEPPGVAELLGHSDIAVTRIYSHLLPEHLDQALDVVDFSAAIPNQEAA